MQMNHIEVDWSNYESPISVDFREQEKQFEKDVIKVIASYNITVDADELVKALRYDRNQYEKGYKAGYNKGYAEGYDAGRLHSSSVIRF
jgi:flagellar biosynthesis/type III secretory pathway protein FliH